VHIVGIFEELSSTMHGTENFKTKPKFVAFQYCNLYVGHHQNLNKGWRALFVITTT